MPSQITSGTQAATISAEHSLYSTTTAGIYELVLNATNMVNGDELEFYAKEKVLSGGTAVVAAFDACVDVQIVKVKRLASIAVTHNVEFFLKQTTGTGRSFEWSVRRLDNAMGTAELTAATIDLVWDEATSGHTTAGTTGKALTDAQSAGDPWSTALPGSYGSGTAGKIVGDNVNATISSRLASGSITLSSGAVTVGTNNDKTGYTLSTTGMNNLLDLTDSVETGLTFRNALRAIAAACAGKISGAETTTITIKNPVADNKNRIVATVDSNGNRTAITYDFT